MASLRHSKYRNPGILFELLVRQTTADFIANKESKAVKILKKYFTNTELGKEYALYNSVLASPKLSESKAEMLIQTIVEQYKKLNKESIQKLKYNLIKEIKSSYDIDEFFKAKVENYRTIAALYNTLESQNTKEVDIKQVFLNKVVVLEHVTKTKLDNMPVSKTIMEELMQEDKEIRLLTYKILVEKFNQKYDNLSSKQKDVLKNYIVSISDTTKLNQYVNSQLNEIKSEITLLSKKVTDKVVKIKLDEIVKLVQPVNKIKDETIAGLLQYIDLIEELNRVHK
jgi:hypothetical protein